MESNVKVVSKNEPPVPVEIIAESIVEISKAMKKISESRLNRRALRVLIKDNTGVAMTDIDKVLNSVESLEAVFLKPKQKNKKS